MNERYYLIIELDYWLKSILDRLQYEPDLSDEMIHELLIGRDLAATIIWDMNCELLLAKD